MPLVTVPGGSLIIPMDTTYQDMGMFQAYGLVDQLLTKRIPVMWAIQPGKPFGGTDVVASATDFQTGAPIADHAYTGGPFVIDAQYAEAAAPIIQAWQAVHTTAVHVATDAFVAPTFATMTRSPRIAVAQPHAASVFDYLNAAGIPDSADRPWSSASLDALGPTDLANGALFGYETGPDAGRVYDLLIVPAAPGAIWSDPGTLAQLNKFVQQGGYLHALGHSIGTLENQIFFLTAEGIPAFGNKGETGTFMAEAPDSGLAQAVPADQPQRLPEPNPLMPFPSDRTWPRDQPGLIYLPGTETMASFRDAAGERHDFMVAGPYKGGSGVGQVSYEGGDAFTCSVPYSQNSEAPYVRFVLNAVLLPVALPQPKPEAGPDEVLQPAGGHLLNTPDDGCPDESPCAAQNCGPAPVPVITKTPATTTVPPGTEVTWTLETANTGINTLFDVVVTDTLPAGFAFVSATPAPSSISFGPGGESVITWTAPAIPPSIPTGAGPIITLTARAPEAAGTYVNQATLSGKDLLGFPHSATTTAEVIVEMVPPPPPTVEIISPPEGSTICGSVTISANASSPAGILNVAFAFSLDGGATWVPIGTDTSGPPFSVTFDTTTVPDGPILIRAVATDNLGRTATDINAYVVDNTPPIVAITSPANGSVVSGTITVTGTATDNIALAFVEWLVDGTVVATQTTPPFRLVLDTTQLTPGPHTITLRACDFCPNCAETSITIIVQNVPPQPPTVEIISPPEGSTICGAVTISATASSPAGILNVAFAFSLDGGATWVPIGTDTSGPPFSVMFDTTTVPDGPILIRAVATDNLGRTATDINAYVVDNTPPVVVITSPANGAVVSGTITVTGTATDNIALAFVEWLVDGTVVATQTTAPFELVIDTTQLTPGPHTITLRACDFCPNCASTSITIVVRTPPPPVSRQVGVDHAIAIPRKKPDVEQILDQRVDVTVETVHVVATPTGTKVVVIGKVCVLLTYAAKVRDQSVHVVEACFPFSTFMLMPGLAPDASVNVTAAVEFTQFQVIDPRTISKFIVLLVTATPL